MTYLSVSKVALKSTAGQGIPLLIAHITLLTLQYCTVQDSGTCAQLQAGSARQQDAAVVVGVIARKTKTRADSTAPT